MRRSVFVIVTCNPEYEKSGIMAFNEERCAGVISVQKRARSSILSTSLYTRMKEKPMQIYLLRFDNKTKTKGNDKFCGSSDYSTV